MPTRYGKEVDHIYRTKQWKDAKDLCKKRYKGCCAICGKSYAGGMIVHHIHPLNKNNYKNPRIAYGQDNLELVCRSCHKAIHEQLENQSNKRTMIMFDSHGNAIVMEKGDNQDGKLNEKKVHSFGTADTGSSGSN